MSFLSFTKRKTPHSSVGSRSLRDDSGQVLSWVAIVLIVCLMLGGLVIDIGHAMVVRRQLQISTDAAALAAAGTLPDTTYSTVGENYSATPSGKNQLPGVSVSSVVITPLCLQAIGGNCSSTSPNAIRVTENASIPTYFARIFGVKNVTVSTTSTAAERGSGGPYNIAIIVDSTLSMNAIDSYCNGETQEQCALDGVLKMLGYQGQGKYSLNPAVDHVALFTFPNVASGKPVGIEMNGIFTCTTPIPGRSGYSYDQSVNSYISLLTARKSTSWNGTVTWSIQNDPPWSGIAWAEPYTFPPVDATAYAPPSGSLGPSYQVVGFSDNYRTSAASTSINRNSSLVMAAGGVSGCGGLQPSNYDGNYGTYYAGAIYAAQAALLAEQANNPGSTNVMVILGDGNSTAPRSSSSPNPLSPAMPSSPTESTTTYKSTTQLTNTAYALPATYGVATSSGTYPSWVGECGQAVDAAHYAANIPQNGTKVFTIAYGASTSSSSSACASDRNAGQHPNISPCDTMKQMASDPKYFYSDYTVPGGDRGCVSSHNAVTSMSGIFGDIPSQLGHAALIPNNTQ